MKHTIRKSILLVLSLVSILCFQVSPVYADTDGTEMQVVQAENLEIQLGPDWAGVEFELKTDAGLYPGTIAVGEDGVLRLEIGGSSSYVLSCMNSSVAIPDPDQAPATTGDEITDPGQEKTDADEGAETDDASTPENTESEGSNNAPSDDSQTVADDQNENTVAGIPVMNIVLFGGGLVLAVGALVGMKLVARRKAEDADYDDD